MNDGCAMPARPAGAVPLLEAERLSKSYRLGAAQIAVLRGVSLAVRPGEVLAIVGASGAGKSTLLHVLGALDPPDAGEVRLLGRPVYAASARQRTRLRARHIGFVFQFYHLLPELDVLENVLLPALSGHGAGPSDPSAGLRDRARALLEAVGLAHRARHRPAELSGGEQQRAALARALMNEPDLVLADEPTGNLDSVTGGRVFDALLALTRGRGRTLVLVTHNPALAGAGDRILELKDGRLDAWPSEAGAERTAGPGPS